MITLPIVVDMAVDTSKTDYEMVVESDNEEITLATDTVINATIIEVPEYQGAYEITPTQDTQILETADMMATANIVIKPIPKNYGLIEYNGVYLTVR